MRFSARHLLAAALLLAARPDAALAQLIPGGAPTDPRATRRAYLTEVFAPVNATLQEWRSAWENDDVRAVLSLMTEDALVAATEGGVAQGRDAIRTEVEKILPVHSGFRTSTLDFTASGEIAYYAGKFTYLVSRPGEAEMLRTGTFVMVMQHEGRTWRIRSYVEKADPPQTAAVAEGAASPPQEAAAGSGN